MTQIIFPCVFNLVIMVISTSHPSNFSNWGCPKTSPKSRLKTFQVPQQDDSSWCEALDPSAAYGLLHRLVPLPSLSWVFFIRLSCMIHFLPEEPSERVKLVFLYVGLAGGSWFQIFFLQPYLQWGGWDDEHILGMGNNHQPSTINHWWFSGLPFRCP